MGSHDDPFERALELFDEIRQRPREEWPEHLARIEDTELRAAVRELLPETAPDPRLDRPAAAFLSGSALDPLAGSGGPLHLPDFRTVRELGRGGMGIVYEAEQLSLQRRVALKVLPAQLALSERALARFRREAEITARLHHPGIIDVHQVGAAEGVHYLAMELVEGQSLDRLIDRMQRESAAAPKSGRSSRRGSSSSAARREHVENVVRLVVQVADALQHAHEAGVVHRDVKPSNVLLRPDGSAVLTDFGLAREEGLPSLSRTGELAGTPFYVSPEQAMARRVPVDHRTDVFSLGATLYELLTLARPFPGRNTHEVLARILTREPVPPRRLNPAISTDLETIVLKALEKDPERRYASARALGDDLRASLEHRPIQARRISAVRRAARWSRREPWKAALVACLLLAVPGGALLTRELAAARGEVDALSIPGLVETGWLRLVTGEVNAAEGAFAHVLELAPSREDERKAATGAALALLAQDRVAEVPVLLGSRLTRLPARLRTLLVDAGLEIDGADAEPAGESPLDLYLEARVLLGVPSATVGLPDSLLTQGTGLLAIAGPPAAAVPEGNDSLLVQRRRALEALPLLDRACVDDGQPAYRLTILFASWLARDEATARRYARSAESLASRGVPEALAWFHLGLGRELFDPEGALEAFQRSLELDPTLAASAERAATLWLARDDFGAAVEVLERTLEQRPDRASLLVLLAAGNREWGRLEAAEEAIRAALALDPRMAPAHDVLGDVLHDERRLEEAETAYRTAVSLDPNASGTRSDLGWLLYECALASSEQRKRSSLVDQAVDELEKACRLNPANPYARCNLAIVLCQSTPDRCGESIELLHEALRVVESGAYPRFPVDMLHGILGNCFEQQGDFIHAADAHRAALDANPIAAGHAWNLAFAELRAAVLISETKRRAISPEDLLEDLNRARELGHIVSENSYKDFVNMLPGLGGRAQAVAVAVDWTHDYPESLEAWRRRAWLQVDPDLGDPIDPQDALDAIETAASLDQDSFDVQEVLVWSLHAAGQEEEAREVALEASERARAKSLPYWVGRFEKALERMEVGRER